jgi:hypothetical protein
MIEPRDILIIEYLKEHGEADTEELLKLFFSMCTPSRGRSRLKLLTDRGHLKRRKDVDNKYYIYSVEGYCEGTN